MDRRWFVAVEEDLECSGLNRLSGVQKRPMFVSGKDGEKKSVFARGAPAAQAGRSGGQ